MTFFFFYIVVVLFAAEGLDPVSQQLFETILKMIEQTSSLPSASLTAVLFKWGSQYKSPVVPHLRDISVQKIEMIWGVMLFQN